LPAGSRSLPRPRSRRRPRGIVGHPILRTWETNSLLFLLQVLILDPASSFQLQIYSGACSPHSFLAKPDQRPARGLLPAAPGACSRCSRCSDNSVRAADCRARCARERIPTRSPVQSASGFISQAEFFVPLDFLRVRARHGLIAADSGRQAVNSPSFALSGSTLRNSQHLFGSIVQSFGPCSSACFSGVSRTSHVRRGFRTFSRSGRSIHRFPRKGNPCPV